MTGRIPYRTEERSGKEPFVPECEELCEGGEIFSGRQCARGQDRMDRIFIGCGAYVSKREMREVLNFLGGET